jgi:hypothetical protein
MGTPFNLRDAVRAELVAQHAAMVAANTQARALRAEVSAAAAAADWTNLRTMLEQPGRPVPAAFVCKLAKAAKVPQAERDAVLAHARVAS